MKRYKKQTLSNQASQRSVIMALLCNVISESLEDDNSRLDLAADAYCTMLYGTTDKRSTPELWNGVNLIKSQRPTIHLLAWAVINVAELADSFTEARMYKIIRAEAFRHVDDWCPAPPKEIVSFSKFLFNTVVPMDAVHISFRK